MPIPKLVNQLIFVVSESFNLQKRLSVVTSDWRCHWDGSTTSHACDVLNNRLVGRSNIGLWILLAIRTLTYWSHVIMRYLIGSDLWSSQILLNRIKRLFASVLGEPRINKCHRRNWFRHAIFLHGWINVLYLTEITIFYTALINLYFFFIYFRYF